MRIFVVIFLLSLALYGEEGELQISGGVGGFFPLRHRAAGVEVSSFPGLTVPLNLLIGVSDNFDVGVMGEWGYLSDIVKNDISFGSLNGDEYSDYMHGSVALIARWNIVPGYAVSPHLIAGAGLFIERYYHRDFYVGGRLLADYDDELQVVPLFNGVVGADVVFRLPWWHLLIKGEFLFNANKNTLFVTLNISIGFSWMISSMYTL
ncbi:hypothetical protein KAH37_07905 [bacterium]|nr:hypothetical protein [bacterium]